MNTVDHLRALVAKARADESEAFSRYFESGKFEDWAEWRIRCSALERRVVILKSEMSDRERLGAKAS